MSDHDDKIREQSKKFRAELPALLKTIPGKWVCYMDVVRSISETENGALRYGLKYYGMDGGFVIAQVVPHEPIPAWKLGGIGASAVYETQVRVLQEENTKLRAVAKAALDQKACGGDCFDSLKASLDELGDEYLAGLEKP